MIADAAGRDLSDANVTRLKVFINELFVALAELLERRQPSLDHTLSSAERTVRLFLDDLPQRVGEPWTLDSMAAQCGIGRSAFAQHCRHLANATPIEFLTRCRVEAAAKLLRSSQGHSITDIAFECGFQSSQYFATVFRRETGRTPGAFRPGKGRA